MMFLHQIIKIFKIIPLKLKLYYAHFFTIRCGEHSDWGSITLLIQDMFEVLDVSKEFVNEIIKKYTYK